MAEKKVVLLVDDSRISRLMIRAVIENNSDEWDVLEAASGKEALNLVSGNEVDAITLDMNMPGENGLLIAPKLQASCPQAKIALITGNLESDVKDKAVIQGLAFIPKPITEDKIVDFLKL